jgi:hypothetical protein
VRPSRRVPVTPADVLAAAAAMLAAALPDGAEPHDLSLFVTAPGPRGPRYLWLTAEIGEEVRQLAYDGPPGPLLERQVALEELFTEVPVCGAARGALPAACGDGGGT